MGRLRSVPTSASPGPPSRPVRRVLALHQAHERRPFEGVVSLGAVAGRAGLPLGGRVFLHRPGRQAEGAARHGVELNLAGHLQIIDAPEGLADIRAAGEQAVVAQDHDAAIAQVGD